MKADSFKELQSGVWLAADVIVQIDQSDVRSLVETARDLSRKRARICAQRRNDEPIHEMIIALGHETYVRPHLHPNKTESFHVIEGLCDIVLFTPEGSIQEVIRLGDYQSGHSFFYRIADPIFHTLVIRSAVFVIHETTNGPFMPEETVMADWAPEESDIQASISFMRKLSVKVDAFFQDRAS